MGGVLAARPEIRAGGPGFRAPEGPEIPAPEGPEIPAPEGPEIPARRGRKSGPPAEPGLGAYPLFFPSTFFPAFSTSFFHFVPLVFIAFYNHRFLTLFIIV